MCVVALQELNSSVSDIVEGILKMHDTTKVRENPFSNHVYRCSRQEVNPAALVPQDHVMLWAYLGERFKQTL